MKKKKKRDITYMLFAFIHIPYLSTSCKMKERCFALLMFTLSKSIALFLRNTYTEKKKNY